ncbi:MAG: hypothetical protein WC525_07475 [Candidatus Thermoplasmatota archaeon]
MSDIQRCKNPFQEDNDTTPPVTTALLDPPDPTGDQGWYTVAVCVTLNATDDESGVNATYYQVNAGGWVSYTHPFCINDTGVFIIEFYSVDNAGNTEAPKQVELKIDFSPPITSLSISPPNGNNGWYLGNETITLQATDDLSGVNITYYKTNIIPFWCIYTGPFPIFNVGYVQFYSIDNAGNEEPPHEFSLSCLKIDTTPPTIIMDYTWEGNPWHGYTFIFTASCNDALSGMEKVEFYFNGELQETVMGAGPEYVWSYKWLNPCVITIKAVAYDNAGWTASAEIVEPHCIQFQSQWIHALRLRYQSMNIFFVRITEGPQ